MPRSKPQPFLRIPPFPGHRAVPISQPGSSACDAQDLLSVLRAVRVGGTFWAAQPEIVVDGALILAPDSATQLTEMFALAGQRTVYVLAGRTAPIPAGAVRLPDDCDQWWLADRITKAPDAEIWAGANHELALVSGITGCRLRLFGAGRFAGCDADPAGVAVRTICAFAYRNPFSGDEWRPVDAIAQLGEWRRLIDANRQVGAVLGVAGWKRVTVTAQLWAGTGTVPYRRALPRRLPAGKTIIAWKSRTNARVLDRLAQERVHAGEIEDGFIRSSGLGANCVPPLSVIVDSSGIYFDPSGPSDLESLLEHHPLNPSLRSRASALRQRLVQEAVSKYAQGGAAIIRPDDGRRRVLVTGQVEDDRSILTGGGGQSNLDLIRRARELEPDAWIVYKPHPDVEAGHRKGYVSQSDALCFANEVQRDAAIVPLIESVDALHVITSLAGFEALLRGKQVTTHGVPFYAGWGLTRDLGTVPARRSRSLSLDDLVAMTLLVYPRYLDPVTRLPCPAEVVVERMARGQGRVTSPLVHLREWQGRLRLAWRRLAGA